jgi:predicted nuclease of predicted toxin-antitoxin system
MKLLLDEQLSRRILPFLSRDFPGSRQVCELGLEQAQDRQFWAYAAANDYVMVTRDIDFAALSAEIGRPPFLVWLRFGNCGNARIIHALTSRRQDIEAAVRDPGASILEIR